jgi:hypothetical protein
MDSATIAIIVGAVFVFTIVLRLAVQKRVRRSSPRKRYTIVSVLLWVSVSSQLIGAIAAAFNDDAMGMVLLFVASTLLLGSACLLEMRKLSQEF